MLSQAHLPFLNLSPVLFFIFYFFPMCHLNLNSHGFFICILNLLPVRHWYICFSLQHCLGAAAMLRASSILRILKGTCYLISICMIMLKHSTVKFVIKPSSNTQTHLFLLICTQWLVPSKLLLRVWRRNWKL